MSCFVFCTWCRIYTKDLTRNGPIHTMVKTKRLQALKQELAAFDLSFFEEVEDLKHDYAAALEENERLRSSSTSNKENKEPSGSRSRSHKRAGAGAVGGTHLLRHSAIRSSGGRGRGSGGGGGGGGAGGGRSRRSKARHWTDVVGEKGKKASSRDGDVVESRVRDSLQGALRAKEKGGGKGRESTFSKASMMAIFDAMDREGTGSLTRRDLYEGLLEIGTFCFVLLLYLGPLSPAPGRRSCAHPVAAVEFL